MATFERIRQMSPYALGLIAAIFVLMMVAGDLDLSVFNSSRSQDIASVDGRPIGYNKFENLVRQQIEAQKNQFRAQGQDPELVREQAIRNQAWSMLVDEKVFDILSEDASIDIADRIAGEELRDNPPPYMRQSFTDSSGNFMQQQYVELVSDNDAILNLYPPEALQNMSEQQKQDIVNDFRQRIIQASEQIKISMKESTVRNIIQTAGSFISPSYAKQKYTNENSYVDFEYVKFDINSIKDDEVTVSEEDIKNYYSELKSVLKGKEKRKIKYVSFPLIPSASDSQKVNRRIAAVQNAIQENMDNLDNQTKAFNDKMNDYGGFTSDYTLVHELDENVSKYLTGLETGAYFGPVRYNGAVHFLRLDDRREGEEMAVEASHILINFDNNKDSALAEANKIYALAKNGGDFAELAKEYSKGPSNVKGGSLGFFGKGQMVPEFEEAAFAAEVDVPTKPVESQFGYHIILVTRKVKEEIKYSDLEIKTKMSDGTKRLIYANARNFYEQVSEKNKDFDELAAVLELNVTESAYFDKEQTILGNNFINNFAFDNAKGTTAKPIEVENYGVVVFMVSESLSSTDAPFENNKDDLEFFAKNQKKLDVLKSKAEEAYQSANVTLQSMTGNFDIKKATNVKNNGSIPSNSSKEWAVTQAAYSIPVGEISKPIRGENGYYIIRVSARNPLPEDMLSTAIENYKKTLSQNLKRQVYFSWFRDIKSDVEIEDNRSTFYRTY